MICISFYLPVASSDERSELLQTVSDGGIATEHFEATEDGGVFHEADKLRENALQG